MIPPSSQANWSPHWRAGLGLGFGGAGIQKQVTQEDGRKVVVERAEYPGTMHFFADTIVLPKWVAGVEHARGARLGPFSSGVSFSSIYLNHYFLSPAPEVIKVKDTDLLFISRWAPYAGGSAGIAEGTITREADKVPTVSSSGVFLGIRGGFDYLYKPNIGLKAEMTVSATFFQTESAPALMGYFSMWLGVYFPVFR